MGIVFFGSQQEWMAQPLISLGGIRADAEGETCVPGLFVAGRARSIDAGVYIGGWCQCSIAATGYRAGESMARYVKEHDMPRFDTDFVRRKIAERLSPLGRKGIAPKDVIRSLQEIRAPVDVSILKTGEGLSNGLNRLEELQRNVIPAMGAEDPHYLGKLEEARGVSRLTEVYLKSALARRESRGGHFRADYPRRDDAHGIYWIIAQKRDGEMVVDRERLPLERYPVAPTRFYMDNFDFSKTFA